MSNAKRDQNGVPTLICALNTDGITPTRVKVNPVGNKIKYVDATTGTDHGRTVAVRDENFVPVLMAISSADGVTPVEVYADSSGNLLINSQ